MISYTKVNMNPPTNAPIHPDTRIGRVHLTVANLERQTSFYQHLVGLQIHWQEGSSAGLGAGGDDLLRLTQVNGARRYLGVTGIYHFAILLPERRELARCIARLSGLGYTNHPTDHIMTQTTYLDDPEGNNIELYVDTPEEGNFGLEGGELVAQRANGKLSNGREPLDLATLFRELRPADRENLHQPMPTGTTLGHVHLYVRDLDESMDFYHKVMGFDNMGMARNFRMGMVSAGGYHHHVGFNTWVGQGAPPPPDGALGLRYFSVMLPETREVERMLRGIDKAGIPIEETAEGWLVRDPSNNGVLLVS
jgi:catechol 2,3-dioxygenase